MPAKDTRKIPDKEKAKIIAEKRFKTAKEVAAAHGVSPGTVYSLEHRVSDKVLEMAETFAQRIIKKAQQGVEAGVEQMAERVKNPNEPLSAVNQSVKTLHDIYRLESGQSTSNVSVQGTYELRCREYLEAITKHDPGASVERKREYLLNSSALADVPVEVREKVVIPE